MRCSTPATPTSGPDGARHLVDRQGQDHVERTAARVTPGAISLGTSSITELGGRHRHWHSAQAVKPRPDLGFGEPRIGLRVGGLHLIGR
jgi:hypothetical protein